MTRATFRRIMRRQLACFILSLLLIAAMLWTIDTFEVTNIWVAIAFASMLLALGIYSIVFVPRLREH